MCVCGGGGGGQGGGGRVTVKGKLAHNFMTSYLVFISCLLDMVKKSITEK